MFRLVGKRLVEWATVRETDVLERLDQNVFVKFLGATKADFGHGGALLHDHQQNFAFDINAHVVEQAQTKKCADGGRRLFVAVGIANAHRNGPEHRAGLDPLQPFDANVFNGKWCESPRGLRQEHAQDCADQAEKLHKRKGHGENSIGKAHF